MFEHSVKVPRPYKLAANIFKKVATEGGSVKTLLYDNKLRHFRTNALFALITETIKNSAVIDKIFESSSILINEPRLDPWLAKVLTAELLFGKKSLPGKSKPETTISSYKEQFEKSLVDHQGDVKTEAVRRPRYVRINTNLLATSDAIRAFQDEEYKFIRCTSGSYDDYLNQVRNLTEYEFTQDYHVKTVYVFPPGTKLHEHELYLENKIILQDKATTLAVHLLAPPQGAVALDMCAAPGMKTTQLSAYMRNEGKIYAVERNEDRYKTLCDFVERAGCKNVTTIHKDSLEIKRGDYDDVEYILLDPSCSGSGMEFSVHNYIEPARLAKLTSLQEKFLKHAMNSFPKAKRIVYSTCSLFPEENERVVTNTVKVSRSKWRVQDVKELLKGQWNNFGSNMYGSIGVRCLYAKPDLDLTTGFFLAVLDRDPKDFEKQKEGKLSKSENKEMCENDTNKENTVGIAKKKKEFQEDSLKGLHKISNNLEKETAEDPSRLKKRKDLDTDNINEFETEDKKKCPSKATYEPTLDSDVLVNEDNHIDIRKKKNKKKKRKVEDVTEIDGSNSTTKTHDDQIEDRNPLDTENPSSKKKKHKRNVNQEPAIDNVLVQDDDSNVVVEKKKNKHKKRKVETETEETDHDIMNENNNVETYEPKRKQKKQNRNIDEPTNDDNNSMQSEDCNAVSKKKKNKHKKKKVVNETKNNLTNDEETNSLKNKKSKLKDLEIDDSENVQNEVDKPRKKKKRNKVETSA